MANKGQKVKIVDVDKVKNDEYMDKEALAVIESCDFKGEITKQEDGINFVGFKSDKGWVTLGFKDKEIKEVE